MNKSLSHLKCQACTGNTPKFNVKVIQENLKKTNKWNVNEKNEMIYKKFSFKKHYTRKY